MAKNGSKKLTKYFYHMIVINELGMLYRQKKIETLKFQKLL